MKMQVVLLCYDASMHLAASSASHIAVSHAYHPVCQKIS